MNIEQCMWKWVTMTQTPDDILKQVTHHCVLDHISGIDRPTFNAIDARQG